jgi:hypothetical protein
MGLGGGGGARPTGRALGLSVQDTIRSANDFVCQNSQIWRQHILEMTMHCDDSIVNVFESQFQFDLTLHTLVDIESLAYCVFEVF